MTFVGSQAFFTLFFCLFYSVFLGFAKEAIIKRNWVCLLWLGLAGMEGWWALDASVRIFE